MAARDALLETATTVASELITEVHSLGIRNSSDSTCGGAGNPFRRSFTIGTGAATSK